VRTGGGVHAALSIPFHYIYHHVQSCSAYAPAERADTFPYFISIPICTLWTCLTAPLELEISIKEKYCLTFFICSFCIRYFIYAPVGFVGLPSAPHDQNKLLEMLGLNCRQCCKGEIWIGTQPRRDLSSPHSGNLIIDSI
jgi:hypothetical protein